MEGSRNTGRNVKIRIIAHSFQGLVVKAYGTNYALREIFQYDPIKISKKKTKETLLQVDIIFLNMGVNKLHNIVVFLSETFFIHFLLMTRQ